MSLTLTSVYTTDKAFQSARLSGQGEYDRGSYAVRELQPTTTIPAPELFPISLMGCESHDAGSLTLPPPNLRHWGYGFHRPCWELLNAAALDMLDSPVDIQACFDVCRSFPVLRVIDARGGDGRSGVWEGDELPAAPARREPFGQLWSQLCEYTTNSDPFRIPKLTRVLRYYTDNNDDRPEAADPGPAVTKDEAVTKDDAGTKGEALTKDEAVTKYEALTKDEAVTKERDPFSTLPTEILYMILSLISMSDVVNLRQASRNFHPLPLLNDYWRLRFLRGEEFEYIFEGRLASSELVFKGRWKELYYCIMGMQSETGIWIRQRLWPLACGLVELIAKRASTACLGVPISSSLEESDAAAIPDKYTWITCLSIEAETEYAEASRRAVFQRMVAIPVNHHFLSLAVSTVTEFGERYVSGLRFVSQTEDIQLGHVDRNHETILELKAEEHGETQNSLIKFHLSADEGTIRGLAVSSSQGIKSAWAGDDSHDSERQLDARLIHQSGDFWYLKGDFDVRVQPPCPLGTKLLSEMTAPNDNPRR